MSALGKVAKALAKAAEKGMDTSPAARKARAVEQGYLTNKDLFDLIKKNSRDEFYNLDPALKERNAYLNIGPDFDSDFLADPVMLFHGTAGDISSFNPNMLGRSTKAASAHHGTFLTNLSDDAREYSQIAKENSPLLSRKVNVLAEISQKLADAGKDQERMLKYGAPQVHIDKNKEYIARLRKNLLRASQAKEEAYPATYPVYARIENPLFIDKQGEGYGDITKSLSRAKQQGNDSVVFFDITDPTPGATHLAVFDPSRIRSIHAMFDPERINSRDLLASMAGLGGIGLTDEMLEEQEPEGYAGGGLVKAGSKVGSKMARQLEELLENLWKHDPERMKRAEEAGFDANNIWLHGTANQFDTFKDPYRPDDPQFFFTTDLSTAHNYARSSAFNKEKQLGSLSDEYINNPGGENIIPVFLRPSGEKFPFANDKTSAMGSPYDIRSIFNDFTEESLKSDKFASGGLVECYPYN